MQENQPNTSPDVKTGTQNQSEKTDKAEKNTPGDKDSKDVDELVQGKKLDNKNRGGDTQDVDEIGKS